MAKRGRRDSLLNLSCILAVLALLTFTKSTEASTISINLTANLSAAEVSGIDIQILPLPVAPIVVNEGDAVQVRIMFADLATLRFLNNSQPSVYVSERLTIAPNAADIFFTFDFSASLLNSGGDVLWSDSRSSLTYTGGDLGAGVTTFPPIALDVGGVSFELRVLSNIGRGGLPITFYGVGAAFSNLLIPQETPQPPSSAVPEPASLFLLDTGLLGLGVRRWWQSRPPLA